MDQPFPLVNICIKKVKYMSTDKARNMPPPSPPSPPSPPVLPLPLLIRGNKIWNRKDLDKEENRLKELLKKKEKENDKVP